LYVEELRVHDVGDGLRHGCPHRRGERGRQAKLGCPVDSRTASQRSPHGSMRFFSESTSGSGTCVKARCNRPTITSVLPAIAACTAQRASCAQKIESIAFAGTLRIM